MDFPEEFRRFVAPGAERLVCLAGMLASRGLSYTVIRTGAARHLALRSGREAPRLIIVAHYDRVAGSPGVLDNSCACYELVDFAARLRTANAGLPLLFVFTDAEEAPGTGSAADQGSLALARAIVASAAAGKAGGPRDPPPPVLVLDVTGRGDRLLLSSAPVDLLKRQGRGSSPAAHGHATLVALVRKAAARAGLAEPLSLRLPWSDDLGLVLGGLAPLTLSLLPSAEAEAFRLGGEPETWGLLHGPGDTAEAAEEAAFSRMACLLDALALELGGLG